MTAAFKTTKLVGDRVLVQGTDFLGTEGKTVLDAAQWTELNAHKAWDSATKEFEEAVEQFFAPLTAAADKAKAATKKVDDPITFVVVEEATEGVAAKPAHVVKLTRDSIVLRILENDAATDMLAWVGDELEVLAADQSVSSSAPSVPTAEEVTAIGAEALNQSE